MITKEELRLKHPNSSAEEIDALHAQLTAPIPHPDTTAENAALETARNAPKKPRSRSAKKK
jgi:hypothetical protein